MEIKDKRWIIGVHVKQEELKIIGRTEGMSREKEEMFYDNNIGRL